MKNLVFDVLFDREYFAFFCRIRRYRENIFEWDDVRFIEENLKVKVAHVELLYPSIDQSQILNFRGDAEVIALVKDFNLFF